MKIEHKNLIIRNAKPADAEQLAAWWNDEFVMAHAGFPQGLGIAPCEIIERIRKENEERRTLIILMDDLPLGEMNYRKKDDDSVEIGIKICSPAHQNKGLGKIILSLLISRLFEMGYHKIVLDTNLQNIRAQRTYEKLGFQKVRVNIDSWTDQLGKLQSSVDYELTKEDFRRFD